MPAPKVSSLTLARRGDVEDLAVLALAVGPLRADRHDRARREHDVAVLDLLQADPCGKRRDRLEPQHLLDRTRDQRRLGRQQGPLPGARGEQPDRVRELARGGVDAASQQVRHQLDALRRRTAGPPSTSRAASRSLIRSSPGAARLASSRPVT